MGMWNFGKGEKMLQRNNEVMVEAVLEDREGTMYLCTYGVKLFWVKVTNTSKLCPETDHSSMWVEGSLLWHSLEESINLQFPNF